MYFKKCIHKLFLLIDKNCMEKYILHHNSEIYSKVMHKLFKIKVQKVLLRAMPQKNNFCYLKNLSVKGSQNIHFSLKVLCSEQGCYWLLFPTKNLYRNKKVFESEKLELKVHNETIKRIYSYKPQILCLSQCTATTNVLGHQMSG